MAALERLPELVPVPQPAEGVTYAAKIDKAEARIDWTRPAEEIARQIRALSPAPGAWCEVAGERVKMLRARAVPGRGRRARCWKALPWPAAPGALEVDEAQREGKRAMAAAEVLNGLALPARLG